MPGSGYKRCTKCGEEKELADFPRGKPYCRACKKAEVLEKARLRAASHYRENKTEVLEDSKRKREENLEQYRARGRRMAAADRAGAKRRTEKWLDDPANRERKRQKDREWREKNRERKAANDKRWAAANPERRREATRRYARNNPKAIQMRAKINGARRRGTASPSYETRDFILILEKDPCCFCGEPMEHIDHIEPLAKGGEGEWENLTSACGPCNHRKHAKSLLDFLLQG